MAAELNEEELAASLEGYKMQVSQLEMALGATLDTATQAELSSLLNDMRELVQLTQESLLALKKSKLMAMFESPAPNISPTPASTKPSSPDDMETEFAAFQAAIAESDTNNSSHNSNGIAPCGPSFMEAVDSEAEKVSNELQEDGSEEDEEDIPDDPDENVDDIVGARCRVRFTHEWGEQRQHNAMIIEAVPIEGDCEPKVRVMFCNPTHRSLVPCPFYLEGRCRFEDDKCRYSHGQIIPMEEIEEFQEADHSSLKLESRCLARYKDGVWYPAIVVEVGEDHKFKVMFDKYQEAEDVDIDEIIPLDDVGGEESDDEGKNSKLDLSEEEEETDAVPVYLWRPNQTTDSLGDWEKHTKGFGSKIMAKMGYITGQGLGKNAEGRAEPVPIQLLPPGKSLDKIMELKEQAGDQDLYDVLKKGRRKQKAVDGKAASTYKKVVKRERTTFDFINKKLTGKKGNLSDLIRVGPRGSKVERKTISASELKNRSDKHINIQLLKTDEEARNVEKEIKRLKESLQRNDGRDKAMAAQVRQRLVSMESYLNQLRSSSASIQRHKQMRSDHKKFTVF